MLAKGNPWEYRGAFYRERERVRCGSTATMCSALIIVLVSSSA